MKNRRHNPSWSRLRERTTEILRSVLKHGDIQAWADRLHVDRSIASRWTGLEDGAPEIPDVMLLPEERAKAYLRALLREFVRPVTGADARRLAVQLVGLASKTLHETDEALRDQVLTPAEVASLHSLADQLESLVDGLRAVRPGR